MNEKCLSFPFRLSNLGGVPTVDVGSVAHIEGNLTQILTTRIGERAMLPEYGSDINYSLFENIDTPLYNILVLELIECLERQETRISIQPENINITSEDNTVYIQIFYTIKADGSLQEFKLQLD